MGYKPRVSRDSDLAEYRFMVLYKTASEGAQAREVLAVIRDIIRNSKYNDFYHKTEVSKLHKVLERWGIPELNVEVLKDLLRKAAEPQRR